MSIFLACWLSGFVGAFIFDRLICLVPPHQHHFIPVTPSRIFGYMIFGFAGPITVIFAVFALILIIGFRIHDRLNRTTWWKRPLF